jgi:hypothetical protein
VGLGVAFAARNRAIKPFSLFRWLEETAGGGWKPIS